MGGDGGVVATQRRFIRGYKNPEDREEQKNVKLQQRIKTQVCAQSSERLIEPIVACELGYLYNKEQVLTALLEKRLNESFSHVRGLKDLKTLRLEPNPAYNESQEATSDICPFICPITRVEFSGSQPFVLIWTTGFVLAERAIREIGIEGLQTEYGPFSSADIVRLIPTDEELEIQKNELFERRALEKRTKKETKKRSQEEAQQTTDPATMEEQKKAKSEAREERKSKKQLMEASLLASSSRSGKSSVISTSHTLAASAMESVGKQEEKSSVFKKLFHKGHEADKHDRDLFMSVAGMRYTLS